MVTRFQTLDVNIKRHMRAENVTFKKKKKKIEHLLKNKSSSVAR